MTPAYAEPMTFDLSDTLSRFGSFFYQCYLIPLLLAIVLLSIGNNSKCPSPKKIIAAIITLILSSACYILAGTVIRYFTILGTISQIILIVFVIIYAVLFSPLPKHVRLVVVAATIAQINWAQSISTQIFMPIMSVSLSNLFQFLLLLAALIVIFLFRPNRSDHMPAAYWLTMLITALISVFCLASIRLISGQQNSIPSKDKVLSIVLSAFFIVNLLFYYLYHILTSEYQRANELSTIQAKLAQDLEFYKRSDAMCQEYHSLRHELKNHFSVMEVFLKEKRYDELQQYFDKYSGENLHQLEEFQSPNPFISSVIAHQSSVAKAAGVTLDVIAAVPQSIGIDSDDLCSLLANLLDNAVEGCLRFGNNIVKATLHTDKNCLFISVSNPASSDLLEKNPKLLTSKTNRNAHGYGIPIIRKIVDKYDGAVNFSMNDGWFHVDAMLYMQER